MHSRCQVQFTNNGGDGRFQLVPASLWPPPHQQLPASSDGHTPAGTAALSDAAARAALAPFLLEPRELDLPAGAAGSLCVDYTPAALGEDERGFVLVCDNCRVSSFLVRGCGTDVDVRLEEADGRPCPSAVLAVSGAGAAAAAAGGGKQPLWMGHVVPGAEATRELRVRNTTPVALPFWWVLEPLETGEAAGAGAGACGGGGVASDAFRVEPASGMLQPGEWLAVSAAFAPRCTGHASARARLVVDRAASARAAGVMPPAHAERDEAAAAALAALVGSVGGASEGRDGGMAEAVTQQRRLEVLSVALQGVGAPAALQLEPPALRFAGALTRGQRAEARLVLRNPTDAPVEFQFDAPSDLDSSPLAGSGSSGGGGDAEGGGCAGNARGTLALAPNGGAVPPRGSCEVAVSLRPSAAGAFRRQLTCAVRHGCDVPLEIAAQVQEPAVVPVAAAGVLDFGLLRVGHSLTKELRLRNTSPFCAADWSLQQIDEVGGDKPAGTGAGSAGSAACSRPPARRAPLALQLDPPAGELPPSGECSVCVTCAGAAPGPHRMVLRCASGSGAHSACVEAVVTVVVPDVRLEPCR